MAMGITECTERSGVVSGVVTEEVAGIIGKVETMEVILVKGGVFVGLGVGKTRLGVIVERLGRCRGVKSLKVVFLEMSCVLAKCGTMGFVLWTMVNILSLIYYKKEILRISTHISNKWS
ncbi:hypothetical protein PS2_043943 [Malus domestica]